MVTCWVTNSWKRSAFISLTCISVTYSAKSRKCKSVCNLRNGVLLTFCFKLFVQRSTLHRVVYRKRVKECEEISCIALYIGLIVFEELVSQNTDFRICIFCTFAVLFLVWLSHEETDCCDTGYVQFQFRFIHFVSLRKIQ